MIITKILSVLMSVVVFFGVTVDAIKISKEEIPPEAIHLKYGERSREHLNLYMPEGLEDGEDVTVVMAIHPGTWFQHDELWYNKQCIEAAENGYVAVSIEWCQVQDGATLFHMMDDFDASIECVKDYLLEEGYNPENLIMASHSSGAQLMLEYAYNYYDTCPIDIAFVVDHSGPTTFIDETETNFVNNLMSYAIISILVDDVITPFNIDEKKDVINSVSPIELVNKNVPPTIICHGDADTTTPYAYSQNLYDKLKANGVGCELITYEGADHMLGSEFTEANQKRNEKFKEFEAKYCK